MWSRIRILAALALISMILPRAHAGAVIDGNIFYFTDSFTHSSSTPAYKRTLWDASFGFELTKKGGLVLAWNYGSMTFGDNTGSTDTTLTVTDMGPKLSYFFTRDKTWNVSFTYNLVTKANYSSGTSTQLRGSSMKADLAFTPMISDNFFMGVKINYYKASFNEEVTNTTSLAHVSDGRTAIYPSLTFVYRWE